MSKVKNVFKFILSQKIFLIIIAISFIGYCANLNYDFKKNAQTKTYRRLLTSYDITSNTFLPYEILTRGRIDFSKESIKAMQTIEGLIKPHSVIKIGDKWYSGYPIMAGILAVPVYAPAILLNKIPTLLYQIDYLKILVLGRIAGSFYTALCVGIFYLILKNILRKLNKPVNFWTYIFIFFYAFATNLYSIASRGLWQHTSSLLFNSLIILFLIYAEDNPKFIKWTGLLCGLSFIARPTNIFMVLFTTLYIFIKKRKEFLRFAVLGGLMGILLVAYNWLIFGSPFTNEYVARNDTSFSTPILTGLIGYLFSPSRSFLFVTPPLILSYYAIYKNFFKKGKIEVEVLLKYLGLAFISTLLMLSTWWCWYGADRFGYGFLTEWLPIIGLFTFLTTIEFKKPWKIILIILMVYSLYTQVNAVWFRKSRCNSDHVWDFYCLKPVLEKQDY